MKFGGILPGLVCIAFGMAGCDYWRADRIEFDPLSDSRVEWRPVAEELIASGNCVALFRVALALSSQQDQDGGAWLHNQIADENPCRDLGTTFYPMVLETASWTAESTHGDRFTRQVERDRHSGLPTARSGKQRDYARLGIDVPDDVIELEREWIARCEGPMALLTQDPYAMRQALAAVTDDDDWLLPDWEVRIQECVPLGGRLVRRYEAMMEAAPGPERQQVLSETATLMRQIMSSIIPTEE